MMDKSAYLEARDLSSGLFNNALVLPVTLAILQVAGEGGSFKLGELGEALGGRSAPNSIREALKRLEAVGAVQQLTSLGPPYPNVWQKQPHPFWTFVADWVGHLAASTPGAGPTA
jgi:hypothetical protein